MADDQRPDARDSDVAAWLAVDPLDDVTRRRLVTTALREGDAAPVASPSRAWRWIAAAAAVVVLLAGGLALLTANGGNDEQQATRSQRTSLDAGVASPKTAAGAVPNVGDFGNLDEKSNLDRLRISLTGSSTAGGEPTSRAAAPEAAAAAGEDATSRSGACRDELPKGTVVAEATGTLDGRAAVVVLTRLADGSHSFDAVLSDPCEVRHLP